MKKKMRNIMIGLGGLTVLTTGVLALASHYFYNVSVKRNRKDFLQQSGDLPQSNQTENDGAGGAAMSGAESNPDEASSSNETAVGEWLETQPYETWNLVTNDGLNLVGYYLPAEKETTKTAILAHGYTSQGKDMAGFARMFRDELGFNVLMPDDRGHGASEGDYIGFGWPDRLDYLKWIDKAVERVGPDAQIVLHGISMGGATVMMVSGETLPSQVKAIVEDCGYTSVADQLAYQLGRMYKLPSFPLLHTTNLMTNLRAGYDFYQASSVEQVKKATVPMLFIHGSEDTFVPTDMVYQCYEACPTDKDLLLVEGAGHALAYTTDKQAYTAKVAAFIGKYVD